MTPKQDGTADNTWTCAWCGMVHLNSKPECFVCGDKKSNANTEALNEPKPPQ